MRRRRRYYKRGSSRAAKWFFVCCTALVLAIVLKIYVPDITDRVKSTFKPVFEKTAATFTYFGEALTGEGKFTDVFASIFNLRTEN